LHNVARLRREGAGLRMFGLLCRKQMLVFLHRRATPGSVRNDGVKVVQLKHFQVLSREIACGIAKSRVRRKRAAARLLLRNQHSAGVGREHADGRLVQSGKCDVCDAAREKRHSRAAWTHGSERRAEAVEEKFAVNLRKKPFALRQTERLEYAYS